MADVNIPSIIRVRISSENAEAIGLSPVVAQDMPMLDLVGRILGVTGKDAPRVCEILSRGSFVAGASRFRWAGIDCETELMTGYLKEFPDPDPTRPFDPSKCHLVTFQGGGKTLAIERAAGEKRRLFRRRSFWEELMAIVSPEYADYSYRESADVYRWNVDSKQRLQEAATLLAWSSYEAQLKSGSYATAELYCRR
jgi:hypothetical protein